MKKKILIISGGVSKERTVSLETGKQVAKELKKNNYKVKISEPENLSKNIKEFKPNVIFNALHGQFGEDGYIQSIIETFNIPYTHSEDKPSKKLLAKNEAAFGHTGLLFLLARTPGAPIVKEVKPAAMIGYRGVRVQCVKDKHNNEVLFHPLRLFLH